VCAWAGTTAVIVGALLAVARLWGVGPMTMNHEGPRPTHCRKCGAPLEKVMVQVGFDARNGSQKVVAALRCPRNAVPGQWCDFTWYYHWSTGWGQG